LLPDLISQAIGERWVKKKKEKKKRCTTKEGWHM